jgi:DNA-binding transcriptional ArsR family regulator
MGQLWRAGTPLHNVSAVQDDLPDTLAITNVFRVTDALSAAAEPTRRRILQLLAPQPRTVSEIASEFPVTRSAISQHLLLLESVGLVAAEKVGRQRIYRVVPSGLRSLQAEIDRFWTDELDLLVADAHALNQRRNRPAVTGDDR